MTTIQMLPEDILTRIMWYFPNKPALRECASVNRAFSKIALSFIHSVCILSESDLYIKPSDLCFMKMKTFERIKKFGKYIKTIKMVTDTATPSKLIPVESFWLLLPYLPNIIVFDLSCTKFWKQYLDLLGTPAASYLFQHVQAIKVVSGGSRLPTNVTNMVDLMKRYFKACWQFRRSIRYLIIFDNSKALMMNDNIEKSLEQLVPSFEKLEKLYIYDSKNEYLSESSTFKLLPNLSITRINV